MPNDLDTISLDELDYDVDSDSLDTYPLIPAGTYSAIVQKMEPYRASTGSMNVYWVCQITDSEFAGAPPLKFSTLLPTPNDPKKAWMFGKCLKAVGVSSKDFPRVSEQIAAAVGRSCQVSIYLDNYQGQQRSKIGQILPADAATPGAVATASQGDPF